MVKLGPWVSSPSAGHRTSVASCALIPSSSTDQSGAMLATAWRTIATSDCPRGRGRMAMALVGLIRLPGRLMDIANSRCGIGYVTDGLCREVSLVDTWTNKETDILFFRLP